MAAAIAPLVVSALNIAAGSVAATVVSAFVSVVVGAAVSMAVGALFRKKPETMDMRRDQTMTVRLAAASQRIIYGAVRTGGIMVFGHTANMYGSRRYWETGSGPRVTVRYDVDSVIAVEVFKQQVSEGPDEWTTLTETTGTPVGAQYRREGRTFITGMGGYTKVTYNTREVSHANAIWYQVVVLAGHEVEEIGDVYFNDELVPLDAAGNVTSGRYKGWAQVRKYRGTANQEADAQLIAESSGKWTAAHRGRGHAYIVVRLVGSSQVFPNGVPNVQVDVRGKNDILDPRTGLRGYTNNFALCLADYFRYKKMGVGCADDEIGQAALIAAANLSAESVAKVDGGTEPRYCLDGVIDSGQTHEEVVKQLLTAGAGNVIWSGAAWVIKAAAYETPTITLDDGDLRGPVSVVPAPSKRSRFNAVKGVYSSETHHWQPDDYPPVTNALYEAQDGERIYQDLDLPFTVSGSACQRIAKIALERNRAGLVYNAPCKLTPYQLLATDTVMIDRPRWGWVQKPFEIVDWKFVVTNDDQGAPSLGVDLVLKETGPGVYDWNSGEETRVDTAPNTTLPSAWDIGPPAGLTVTEELYQTRDARGLAVKVTLSALPSADGNAASYQFEYKLVDQDVPFTILPPVTVPQMELFDVAPGTYDVRVFARNWLGVLSETPAQVRKEIKGLTELPADITALTAVAISSLAYLQWDQHPALDVRVGGRIHIRHTQATTGQKWDESYSVVAPIDGAATSWITQLKGGSYGLRAQDSGGRMSANVTWVVVKDASIFVYTTLASITESPTFPGVKSGTDVENGELRLAGAGLFDSIPDLDAVENLDYYGGVVSAGEYAFNAGYDAGAVKRLRITTHLNLRMVNELDLIDSRTELIDDWADFDGLPSAGVLADATIMVRYTDDDPLGAPVWSAWQRLITGDFQARAFQFKAALSTTDNACNVHVDELGVDIQEIA